MAVECAKHELLFFEPKAVQYSILKREEISLRPLSSIEHATVISFGDRGYSDDLRDLGSCYISMKVKLNHMTTATATAPAKAQTTKLTSATLDASVVNNLLHSLIKQVTVKLNGVQIQHNNVNYAYRYLRELSFSKLELYD